MERKAFRQRKLGEMTSDGCKGCHFLDNWACHVPGGTCIHRSIDGVPGQFVGDILANVGAIDPKWDEQNKLPTIA